MESVNGNAVLASPDVGALAIKDWMVECEIRGLNHLLGCNPRVGRDTLQAICERIRDGDPHGFPNTPPTKETDLKELISYTSEEIRELLNRAYNLANPRTDGVFVAKVLFAYARSRWLLSLEDSAMTRRIQVWAKILMHSEGGLWITPRVRTLAEKRADPPRDSQGVLDAIMEENTAQDERERGNPFTDASNGGKTREIETSSDAPRDEPMARGKSREEEDFLDCDLREEELLAVQLPSAVVRPPSSVDARDILTEIRARREPPVPAPREQRPIPTPRSSTPILARRQQAPAPTPVPRYGAPLAARRQQAQSRVVPPTRGSSRGREAAQRSPNKRQGENPEAAVDRCWKCFEKGHRFKECDVKERVMSHGRRQRQRIRQILGVGKIARVGSTQPLGGEDL